MLDFFKNGCTSVFMSIFLFFMGLASIAMFYFHYLAIQSYHWTERDGRIETLALEKKKTENKEKVYTKNGKYRDNQGCYDYRITNTEDAVLHLSYSYFWNDSTYQSKELWEGSGDGSSGKIATEIYQKLKNAQKIRVWVNPKNPSDDVYAVRGITKELVEIHMLFIFLTNLLYFFIKGSFDFSSGLNISRKMFSWIFWTVFFISMFVLKYSDTPFGPTADKLEVVEERYIPLPDIDQPTEPIENGK